MLAKTRHCTLLCLILLGLFQPLDIQSNIDPTLPSRLELSFLEAKNLRIQYPDSAIHKLEIVLNNSIDAADTVIYMKSLMELAKAYSHQANYKESYDKLWTALLLADAANDAEMMSSIYTDIGRHYSFYKRLEKAQEFFNKSLNIKKELTRSGQMTASALVENYYAFVTTYREFGETALGQTYLDSCLMYYNSQENSLNNNFLKFEQAVILHQKGEYNSSDKIFSKIFPWFSEHEQAYQVLIYYYYAKNLNKLGKFSDSERSYKKSLEISNTHNSHIDFTPLVYEGLADLYTEMDRHQDAYYCLKKVNELDASFFDSRSPNNRPLLEIQDDFRKTKEKQQLVLKEQRLAQFEQEEKVLFLQKTILIGCIAFLILFGFLYLKHVRAKYKAEKQLIKNKQDLEIQKANEIVELKNKELAASVLKLIEKETFIDDLRSKLSQGKGDIDRQEIKKIVRSMSNNSAENWKEFEARFIDVNKSFYDRLNKRFPKLTQGDQKLCALVKLNFSSKEMAKLLGISVESVHTTRYRLRKKLKLTRENNLAEFIAAV